jgi:hypothetical protein
MPCFFCGDPAAHPATGCQYDTNVLACHACVVSFWAWVKRHQAKRWAGADFFAAAGKVFPS